MRNKEKLKYKLLNLKSKLKEDNIDETIKHIIFLDEKIENFIKWNRNNMQNIESEELKNFIEKMAVWYELRYPSYEINRLMPGSGQELTKINDVMFKNNPYTKDLFEKNLNIKKELDWDQFYNTKVFIDSLPRGEKSLLQKPTYMQIIYIDPDSLMIDSPHLHLNYNGLVEDSFSIEKYTKGMIKDEDLIGMHIKKVQALIKEKGIILPTNNELDKAINIAEKRIYQKEEILNCVMYRIIERGGCRIGPRRAFLFAKEFNRNIDIPMIYGVDLSDPGLREFMNEYIKAGGSKNLVCYKNYFSKTKDKEKLETITLEELFKFKGNYTNEEKELHQKLVDTLVSEVNYGEVSKFNQAKQLKLKK